MVIFAMGTLLTPCKDSEGTAHVAYSIITQYTNVCSIVLSKGYNFSVTNGMVFAPRFHCEDYP